MKITGAGTSGFSEMDLYFLSDEIKEFIKEKHNDNAYKKYVRDFFQIHLDVPDDNPLWDLLSYLEETDFYSAPASTRFHCSEANGLVRHSLLVTSNGFKLAPAMLPQGINIYYLTVSCMFHDLCKVNMYQKTTRNVKNEETGVWEKVPCYKVRDDYISYGHGIESMLRLNRYIEMPDAWNHAIRWHMGAYDMSPYDKYGHEKAIAKYNEVLFLQTADMQAGLVDEIRHQ